MPSPQWWSDIGGTDAEYNIYRALFATGRQEPADFTYERDPIGGAEFAVKSPSRRIKVRNDRSPSAGDVLRRASEKMAFIREADAILDPDRALAQALGR